MRVHRSLSVAQLAAFAPLARLRRPSRRVSLGAVAVAGMAALAAPATVLATAGSAAAESSPTATGVPALASISVSAPPTVTKGRPTTLTAHLTIGPANLPNRLVQFLARPLGGTTWTAFATGRTDSQGLVRVASRNVTRPSEFGAYYTDAAGAVHTQTATTVVHTIDLTPSPSATVPLGSSVTISGHLLKDVRGLPAQTVKVWTRTSSTSAWSSPITLRTNSSGVAALSRRFTRTTQIGIRFPGANGLAPSPLALATVTVKATAVSASGFVFPFANPRAAQPVSAWTQDQGVDLAFNGYACGASAILVAVGDGVVIQEGISGFGPTAPVLRMTSGPFKGRNVYYGHTGHVYVTVGAHVKAGQRLAQVGCGRVGASSAPHLEIGVGVVGGPPCCPAMHQTSALMMKQLVAALRA